MQEISVTFAPNGIALRLNAITFKPNAITFESDAITFKANEVTFILNAIAFKPNAVAFYLNETAIYVHAMTISYRNRFEQYFAVARDLRINKNTFRSSGLCSLNIKYNNCGFAARCGERL